MRTLLQIGFPEGQSGRQGREELLGPLLDAMSQFRLNVRSASHEKDTAAVLSTCDHVRDVILPELGVRLEVGQFDCNCLKELLQVVTIMTTLLNVAG